MAIVENSRCEHLNRVGFAVPRERSLDLTEPDFVPVSIAVSPVEDTFRGSDGDSKTARGGSFTAGVRPAEVSFLTRLREFVGITISTVSDDAGAFGVDTDSTSESRGRGVSRWLSASSLNISLAGRSWSVGRSREGRRLAQDRSRQDESLSEPIEVSKKLWEKQLRRGKVFNDHKVFTNFMVDAETRLVRAGMIAENMRAGAGEVVRLQDLNVYPNKFEGRRSYYTVKQVADLAAEVLANRDFYARKYGRGFVDDAVSTDDLLIPHITFLDECGTRFADGEDSAFSEDGEALERFVEQVGGVLVRQQTYDDGRFIADELLAVLGLSRASDAGSGIAVRTAENMTDAEIADAHIRWTLLVSRVYSLLLRGRITAVVGNRKFPLAMVVTALDMLFSDTDFDAASAVDAAVLNTEVMGGDDMGARTSCSEADAEYVLFMLSRGHSVAVREGRGDTAEQLSPFASFIVYSASEGAGDDADDESFNVLPAEWRLSMLSPEVQRDVRAFEPMYSFCGTGLF